MSYRGEFCAVTKEAVADLRSHKYKVVELDSNGKVGLSALDKGYGILQNVPNSGEAAAVVNWGTTQAIAAVAVSIGDKLKVQSGGWLTPVASGAAHTGTFMLMGRAMTSAVSGSIFTVELERQLLVNVLSGAAIA